MAENRKPANRGISKLKAALVWGAAQWALDWFVIKSGGLGGSVSAGVGGFAAGWLTTALLNTLARWGLPGKALFPLGILFGVAAVSGAVQGLGSLFSWWSDKPLQLDLPRLQGFLLSWNVVPALALGALTGLWVGRKGGGAKK